MRHATGRFWLMASTEPLFGLRKFRDDVAALEAQGKSLWTEELAQHVRAKVVQALLRMRETYRRYSAFDDLVDAFDEVLVDAIDEVTFQLGIARKSTVGVRSKYQNQRTIDSFLDHITERDGIDTILFSFVEAVWQLTEPLETGSRPELSDNSPRHQLSRHIRETSRRPSGRIRLCARPFRCSRRPSYAFSRRTSGPHAIVWPGSVW